MKKTRAPDSDQTPQSSKKYVQKNSGLRMKAGIDFEIINPGSDEGAIAITVERISSSPPDAAYRTMQN
jgi:hypothetical protein